MLSSGQLVASRMMEGIASGSDFALLVRCSVEGDRVFLESFVGAKGLEALSRLLRRRGAVASLRCAALSSLAVAPSWMLHPDTLLETMQSPLLSPLRLDAVASSAEREDQEENITAVQERQLSLCLLVRVIESSSRERALSWLRHVQRLCRDSALLGRPAELLGHPDVGTVLAAANVLLAWLAHGDQQQQTAAKRELLLLGAHEEVRRMVRHELLGPTMRQLLLQIRANASDDHQASSVVLNEKVIVLNHQETVEQLEHRLGTGRLLFSGCVPQSGVFCRPDMVLRGALLRCERWPLPWKMCIVGHGGILEQSCRIDSRMTGDRAVAYIATCHLDEWDNYRLKVKNGRWIDGKLTLAAQCSDGDTLELKVRMVNIYIFCFVPFFFFFFMYVLRFLLLRFVLKLLESRMLAKFLCSCLTLLRMCFKLSVILILVVGCVRLGVKADKRSVGLSVIKLWEKLALICMCCGVRHVLDYSC